MTQQPKDYPPTHLNEPTYEAVSPRAYCPVCKRNVYQCECAVQAQARKRAERDLQHRDNRVQELEAVLRNIRIHTGHTKKAPAQLHIDLLAHIASIVDNALRNQSTGDNKGRR